MGSDGLVLRAMSDVMHVYPVNDLIDHDLDGHPDVAHTTPFNLCACGPDVTYLSTGMVVVTHHSLDGREQYEQLSWWRRLLHRVAHL